MWKEKLSGWGKCPGGNVRVVAVEQHVACREGKKLGVSTTARRAGEGNGVEITTTKKPPAWRCARVRRRGARLNAIYTCAANLIRFAISRLP